jgi:hypothetical protein
MAHKECLVDTQDHTPCEGPSREAVIQEGSAIAGRPLTFAEAVDVLLEEGYDTDDPCLVEWSKDGK